MKVSDLVTQLNLQVVTGADSLDREIQDCYICDMLSLVMARAKEGDVWITVQTNINTVAVAALSDCACVIIPDDIDIEEATTARAAEKDVTLLKSSDSAFKIAYNIGKEILS